MFVLDSNILRLYLRHADREQVLFRRIQQESAENLWISVITVEESIEGALKFKGRRPLVYYEILAEIIPDLARFRILPYTPAADALFRSWPASLKREAGPNDCRIAASAIVSGFTVVTQNLRDFARIPDVRVEDWTRL